jgi:hypothetical protein
MSDSGHIPEHELRFVRSTPERPQKFTTIMNEFAKQLAALDRYERRALARRKFAIRAFDAARAQTATAPGSMNGDVELEVS